VKRISLVSLFVLLTISFSDVIGQIGGESVFESLNITGSPRVAAMGGDFLAISDNDILLSPSNPSLISPEQHNKLGVSFVDFWAGIDYGFASYSRTFEKLGSFNATMMYLSHGDFEGADETGTRTGTFYSGETVFNLGWGRRLDSLFSIGSNLKFIYGSMESYSSYGLAVDVAGSYHSPDGSFTASLLAKNIGRQLKPYNGGTIEPFPFEIQIGVSKKLKHLPFRYSVLFNHLEKWDLSYEDPDQLVVDPITGEVVEENKFEEIADNFMRHIVFGGELLIGKNLSVRAGYNYGRRQELKISDKTSTVGFSWGIGLRVSKFHLNYARSTWHLAGSPNYISVTTSLSDFFVNRN